MFDKIITNTENSEQTNSVHLSFLITSVILIYYVMDKFKSNFFTPNEVRLFDEYYHDNKLASLFVDHIFVLTYLSISFLILAHILKTNIKSTLNVSNIVLAFIVVTLVTIVLDLIIGYRVRGYKGNNKIVDFFRRWSEEAGYKAIVWDLIYIYTIFIVALLLIKYNLHNNIYAVTLLFVFFLIHIFM